VNGSKKINASEKKGYHRANYCGHCRGKNEGHGRRLCLQKKKRTREGPSHGPRVREKKGIWHLRLEKKKRKTADFRVPQKKKRKKKAPGGKKGKNRKPSILVGGGGRRGSLFFRLRVFPTRLFFLSPVLLLCEGSPSLPPPQEGKFPRRSPLQEGYTKTGARRGRRGKEVHSFICEGTVEGKPSMEFPEGGGITRQVSRESNSLPGRRKGEIPFRIRLSRRRKLTITGGR